LFARSDENVARWEQRLEIPMLVVAGLVIPSLLLDEPGVGEPWHRIGVALNWLMWTAFLVIVVLTPPFLTSVLNGVRLLRLVRVARLLRLKPLVAWLFRSGGLKYAALFTGLVVIAAAQAFSIEENTSYFTALYWAITTVTTVGSGDKLPTTTEAEITAMIVMIVGIGFFAALAGALANQFIEGRTEEIVEAEREALTADEHLLARVDAIAEQLEEVRSALRTRAGPE
jgi:voltage-gated potassium channel